ncbi:MAG: YihA family ribosome biogenesis GTP-binding protein [Rhodospirillaceae bacterium]|nr:YihA family ribosome biogenesis GTP-binding protein [Rhodospirillaceae bacterium]MBT5912454.1 YihA family ribosome biogenesis GTP-binding protein [Rhodospirillaceae bacterium]MBT7730765.1 YihA family ribosome biogenesis GTP-binding protein [Rhodospirillaceae bacterium]
MGLANIQTSYSDDELECGRLLFAKECNFLLGIDKLVQLPESSLPEIAFAGRSNVGKSSLINALTGRKALARTSNTPGRTQQLNFFDLGRRLILVDLPGYGYAKVSKTQVAAWTRTLKSFLRGRVALRRVCLLIDSRVGLKDLDRDMMEMLDAAAVVYQVVLTKVDKLKSDELETTMSTISNELAKRSAAHPMLALTSSSKSLGIRELRAGLASLTD